MSCSRRKPSWASPRSSNMREDDAGQPRVLVVEDAVRGEVHDPVAAELRAHRGRPAGVEVEPPAAPSPRAPSRTMASASWRVAARRGGNPRTGRPGEAIWPTGAPWPRTAERHAAAGRPRSNTGSASTATALAGRRPALRSRAAARPATDADGRLTTSCSTTMGTGSPLRRAPAAPRSGTYCSAPSATTRIRLPAIVFATGPSSISLSRAASVQYSASASSISPAPILRVPVGRRAARSAARRRCCAARSISARGGSSWLL